MIFDRIGNLHLYAVPKYEAILKFIADHENSELPDGEIEIEGRELFVRIMSYEPKPAAENRFEIHRVYADVQYVRRGMEIIQTASVKDLVPLAEYDAKRDIHFFKTYAATSDFILEPEDFAVFYPGQPHRPSCAYAHFRGLVKKLIFKVKI